MALQTPRPYDFGDDPQRFDRAYERVQGFRQDAAARQAGNALKEGDWTGASAALFDAGDVNAGVQLQRAQAAEQNATADNARADAAATRQAELDGMKYVGTLATRLNNFHTRYKDVNRLLAAFDAEAPRLQRFAQETPEEIAAIRAQLAADPEGTLATMGAEAKKYQMANGGDGYIGRFDPEGGTLTELRAAQPKPLQIDPEKDLYVPAPAGGAGPAPPQAGGSRNTRNNNPGNIKDGDYARSLPGYKGSDGVYAVFESPDAGASAQGQLLQSYGQRGLNTVQGIISRWAPKEDNNPTQAYIDFVSRKLGVSPRTPLDMREPQVIKALSSAITEFEGGSGGRPSAAPQGSPSGSVPGFNLARPGQPKPKGHMASAEEKASLRLAPDAQYWIDADGKPAPIAGEKPDKPLTEYQGKSVEYLNAALGGNDRLNDLASKGLYKPQTATDSLFTKPDKDGVKRLILRTDADRQFMQAAKEWLAPILRKDTGAAVTDSELAYYMDIYIPRFEDSPTVMWQKAQARDKKMSALYGANKGSYDNTFGAPAKWKVLTDPRGVPGQKPAAAPGGKRVPLDQIFK